MDPTIVQLRALIAVAQEETFTDAAILLGVTQAAVSRQIQTLERQLGQPVLTRTSRHVELTPFGKGALRHAQRIVRELDTLTGKSDADQSELRIGHAWSSLGRHTTPLQVAWSSLHPRTPLHLVQTNDLTHGLLGGTIHAAITRRDLVAAGVKSSLVGKEKRWSVLSAEDPLAERETLALDDFVGRPVGIDTQTGTTAPSLWPPDRRPAQFRDTATVDEFLILVAAGQVVGITTEATVWQYPRTEIVYRPITDVAPVAVSIAWSSTAPPEHLDDLLRLARKLYRSAA